MQFDLMIHHLQNSPHTKKIFQFPDVSVSVRMTAREAGHVRTVSVSESQTLMESLGVILTLMSAVNVSQF